MLLWRHVPVRASQAQVHETLGALQDLRDTEVNQFYSVATRLGDHHDIRRFNIQMHNKPRMEVLKRGD